MTGVHAETRHDLHTTIQTIKGLYKEVSVAFNLLTPLCSMECPLEEVDLILLMSMDPSFSWSSSFLYVNEDEKGKENG